MVDYERYLGDGGRQDFLKLAAEFDEPAFVRRAQRTEQASHQVFEDCESAQAELLTSPKRRLAMLGRLIALRWDDIESLLKCEQTVQEVTDTDAPWDAGYLKELHERWQPTLRVRVDATSSSRKHRKAVAELASTFQYFNRKWQVFLDEFDLEPVNQVRTDYNNYYVVEKACAFGSEKIGRTGFEPLPPITRDDLRARYPLLRCR